MYVTVLSSSGLLGCNPITPEKVNKIKVCTTRFDEVKEMFGSPNKIGKLANHTTWQYDGARGEPPRLLLLFDDDTVVSDLAYNPAGLVELKSRCSKAAASATPAK